MQNAPVIFSAREYMQYFVQKRKIMPDNDDDSNNNSFACI